MASSTHPLRRGWRHSLRGRLVALFLLLAVGTVGIFVFGTQRALQSGWQGWVRPILADYVDRLAAEIGSPPDAQRAAAIVARLPVKIRIDGPRVHYDSHPSPPGPPRARWHDEHDSDSEDSVLSRTTADGHSIRFGLAAPGQDTRPRMLGWTTLAGLLLLTGVAYAGVRRMLRPLTPIGEGVARFGRGDFATPIAPQRHHDELGELAERINSMAASLKGMLDAKRALLLAISHELRSPLTRARLNAELVSDGPHREALLRDLAEMRDLVTDLLESERLAEGHAALHTEPVALPALVREVLAAQFSERALAPRLDEAMPAVRADPARLRLVVRNLVDNALRHGGDATALPDITLARGRDGQLELTVRDHGPGVTDEQLARLAEPFYRTDAARSRATGGVGLGLALCRLVAQAHGGELMFEHAHPGLKVTMRWPAMPA